MNRNDNDINTSSKMTYCTVLRRSGRKRQNKIWRRSQLRTAESTVLCITLWSRVIMLCTGRHTLYSDNVSVYELVCRDIVYSILE